MTSLFLEIAVAGFYAVAMFLFFAWQKGVRRSALLSELLVLILVDDKMRKQQRAAMMEFISASRFPDAGGLAMAMKAGFCEIAAAPEILRLAGECLEDLHRGARV